MSGDSSTSQRGRLKIGEATTIDMRPPGAAHRPVQLAQDPALGLLSLEERFEDQGEIARGGMGAIHQVIEHTLNRVVAMKVLQPERAHERKVRHRFVSEAQVTGQLQHPNIVPVYELGADDGGKLFFTMRLIEGQTLSRFLQERSSESDEHVEQALEVFFKVCDALSFAHSRGVVHRDVKPSNIMVGDFGQVYLMDWGVARVLDPASGSVGEPAAGEPYGSPHRPTTLTLPAMDERGLVVGTYSYMAPEQARGAIDEIDPRTDVFGLGAVLFRIVAGRPPIEGQTAADALANAAEARIVEPEEEVCGALRKALLEVARQAMQRERERRFQSAESLKRAAQQVLRGRFRFPVQRFAAGTAILVEGDRGDDAYYIRSGTCRVFTERDGVLVELQVLQAGEVFGETAVFTGQPRNASVQALTEAELIVVPGRFLTGSLGLDSWTGAFVRTLGERFTRGSRRLSELEVERTRDLLALAALRLLALEGRRDADGSVRIELAALQKAVCDEFQLSDQQVVDLLEDAGLAVEGQAIVLRAMPR